MASLLVRLSTHRRIDDWVSQGTAADAYCWSLLAEEIAANLEATRAGIAGTGTRRGEFAAASMALHAPSTGSSRNKCIESQPRPSSRT